MLSGRHNSVAITRLANYSARFQVVPARPVPSARFEQL